MIYKDFNVPSKPKLYEVFKTTIKIVEKISKFM